ncbi:MAG: lipid-A-disaccharide synthase-related protein [Vulcanimicrobiota bacterium]
MKRVLLVSNGAGEDAIATRVATHFEGLQAEALPLVGLGQAYQGGCSVVGPLRRFASEGLVRESAGNFLADLRQGLLAHHLRQWRFLRSCRGRYSAVIAVGDLFPVVMAALAGLRPLIFVGTAKSVWHHAYSRPELWLLRWFTSASLTRDEPTAEQLRAAGLRAAWVGNAMMDELATTDLELPLAGLPGLAIFPGSREATYTDFPRLLASYQALVESGCQVQALVALASSIDAERLAATCPAWSYRPEGERLVGRLERSGFPPVLFCRGALGDMLAHCQVALGQAGTANEQAAGAGLPVVAAAEGGEANLGWYRGRQKGLLGEALKVVEPEGVVSELRTLFQEPDERQRRGEIGRQRMGPPGGALRMARAIERLVE